MNLLEENSNYNNKKGTSPKKTVGTLLILSIVALFIVIMIMAVMSTTNKSNSSNKNYKIVVDGTNINISTVPNTEGIHYVALEDIAQSIGYIYYNGEYKGEATETKENCYVKNNNDEIIGFSTTEENIYKTTDDSISEKQYYKLKNKIITNGNNQDEKILISVEDLAKIFHVETKYANKELILNVNTTNNLIAGYKEKIKDDTTVTIDESFENAKLVVQNKLVIVKNGKYGVVDTNFKQIIGNKYKTMKYDEYTTDFIVSNENGNYGVITDEGDEKIDIKYDSLFIINYEPLLYAVTKNQNYGVIDEEGNIVVEIAYDALVCKGDQRNNINSVVIIKNINSNNDNGIVVCKNSKYGIVNLTTGEIILECVADKINSRTNEEGKEEYFVITKDGEEDLNEYIDNANEVTINLPDTNSIMNVIY